MAQIQEDELKRRLEWLDEDLDRAIKARVTSRLVLAQAMIKAQLKEDGVLDLQRGRAGLVEG